MSMSRSQIICAIVALVGVGLYFGNKPSETDHRANSVSEATSDARDHDPQPNTFAGYECTEDCSGHEAGYAWAEEHGISDGDECDAAGEHSNSPSFAEGCHAYVDGEAGDTEKSGDPEERGDSDDDN